MSVRFATVPRLTRHTVRVDPAKTIEAVLAEVLRPRGFRKRARNWFRTSGAGEYQVVNLQKSSWGGGDCYLNLGWDPSVKAGDFLPENQCMARIRAERADVIPAIHMLRSDGNSVLEVPGISLLDRNTVEHFAEDDYRMQVREVVARPVADLLDRTPSVTDLVPLFTRHPGYATLRLRDHLRLSGHELPVNR